MGFNVKKDVVNFFGKRDADEQIESDKRLPLTVEELARGIREDFTTREYLWTGQITPDLYDFNCQFTDPTLTFNGLSTFQRNLSNLDPLIKRFVGRKTCELKAQSVSEEDSVIVCEWRMYGELNLPWYGIRNKRFLKSGPGILTKLFASPEKHHHL